MIQPDDSEQDTWTPFDTGDAQAQEADIFRRVSEALGVPVSALRHGGSARSESRERPLGPEIESALERVEDLEARDRLAQMVRELRRLREG